MTFRPAAAALLCLLVASGAGAQVARDRPARMSEPIGRGSLAGRVVSAEGAPVRRAQLLLASADAGVRKAAVSDGDGRYTFADLPAGTYTIRAVKGGYVSFGFGQTALNQQPPPIILGDGESLAGLTIVLPRGSAVTGRVTDEFGDPILQAQVQAMRFQYQPDGERGMVPAGATATTDDLGQFRLFGLVPGEYVITASVRGAFGNPAMNAPQEEQQEGYAPTFYPGTTNPAEAQPLSVGLGQELSVQIQLVPSRLARITGVIVDSQGRPAGRGAPVMFRQAGAVNGVIFSRPAMVAADGTFTITAVPPGDYVLEVRSRPGPQEPAGVPTNNEFAFVPLSVGGSDITGLRIVTGSGATLSGRVVFEGSPPPPGTRIRVVPQSADPSRNVEPIRTNASVGLVGPDGSFQIEGIAAPLFLRITIDGGRPGTASDPVRYMTKAVIIDGVDVADIPFDPTRRGSVTGVTMVITDKVTEVGGVVSGPRGTPVQGASVLIVPQQLPVGLSPTRFVRLLQVDGNGKFSVRAMPAGNYSAIGLATFEAGRQFDPTVIEQVRRLGERFTLREGGTVALNLEVVSGF